MALFREYMRRALITGIAGFAGSHLAEHLFHRGWEVSGLEKPGVSLGNLNALQGKILVEECDVLRCSEVEAALDSCRPDVIFHLAAVSFPPFAEKNPAAALDVNVRGTLNVLKACRKRSPEARFVHISSAEVYGKGSREEIPTSEKAPLLPVNMYAVTKECSERIALFYGREHGLPVIVIRAFSHIGPRQSPDFVAASFAKQIAEIEGGEREPLLLVGNLDAERDFTDVRDMVGGYAAAAERCESGEIYNICSGRAYSIKELLNILLGETSRRIEVTQDPGRLRRTDMPLIIGDCGKFRKRTGWEPRHAIESTLKSVLDYWREGTRRGTC